MGNQNFGLVKIVQGIVVGKMSGELINGSKDWMWCWEEQDNDGWAWSAEMVSMMTLHIVITQVQHDTMIHPLSPPIMEFKYFCGRWNILSIVVSGHYIRCHEKYFNWKSFVKRRSSFNWSPVWKGPVIESLSWKYSSDLSEQKRLW